jgi:hypothetical protein
MASRQETLSFLMIASGVVVPMILAFVLIGADMRTDLSRTRALAEGPVHGSSLLGWADLEAATRPPEGMVTLLGYMMDGYKPVPDGTPVSNFVLMPEAGTPIHPAHRIADEMIEVNLANNSATSYRDRSLTWVTGRLLRRGGRPKHGVPAWLLADAVVRQAEQRDVGRWFAP